MDKKDLLLRTLAGRPDLIPFMQIYAGYLSPRTGIVPTEFTRCFPTRRSIRTDDTDRASFSNTLNVLAQATNIRDLFFGTCVYLASNPIWKPVFKAVYQMELVKLTYCSSPSDNNQLCRILAA
ncbi:hypothetical protein FRB90_004260 [Tulasnella sp. 427]|nr:hypothetical protein FRB90_004260 [Tulasnella sp. 427]